MLFCGSLLSKGGKKSPFEGGKRRSRKGDVHYGCPPPGGNFTSRRPDFNDQSTDIKKPLKGGKIWCGSPLRWPAPFIYKKNFKYERRSQP